MSSDSIRVNGQHETGCVRLIRKLAVGPLRNWRILKRAQTRFPDSIVTWLKDVALKDSAGRGLVFLSHHQYFTALDKRGGNQRLGEQLAEALGLKTERRVLWLWGHEHRLATLTLRSNSSTNQSKLLKVTHGRAVGNGGATPDPIRVKPFEDAATENGLRYADNREAAEVDKEFLFAPFLVKAGSEKVGHHGFAKLTVRGRSLTIEYRALGTKEEKPLVHGFLSDDPPDEDLTQYVVLSERFDVHQGDVIAIGEERYELAPSEREGMITPETFKVK